MSHLQCIGFGAREESVLQDIAKRAFEEGRPWPHSKGFYVQYRDESGAELWLQFDRQKQLVDLHPHFFSKEGIPTCLTAQIPSPTNEHEGSYFAVSFPAHEDNPDSGRFPFMFDVPDYLCTSDQVSMPVDKLVQLVAFAQQFDTYASKGQLKKVTGQKPLSVIPVGLLGPDGDVAERPKAIVEMTGTVASVTTRENAMTNQPFGLLSVNIDGGTMTIVLPHAELMRCDPQPGHAFLGRFWMSGRLPVRKKGFFERLRQLF